MATLDDEKTTSLYGQLLVAPLQPEIPEPEVWAAEVWDNPCLFELSERSTGVAVSTKRPSPVRGFARQSEACLPGSDVRLLDVPEYGNGSWNAPSYITTNATANVPVDRYFMDLTIRRPAAPQACRKRCAQPTLLLRGAGRQYGPSNDNPLATPRRDRQQRRPRRVHSGGHDAENTVTLANSASYESVTSKKATHAVRPRFPSEGLTVMRHGDISGLASPVMAPKQGQRPWMHISSTPGGNQKNRLKAIYRKMSEDGYPVTESSLLRGWFRKDKLAETISTSSNMDYYNDDRSGPGIRLAPYAQQSHSCDTTLFTIMLNVSKHPVRVGARRRIRGVSQRYRRREYPQTSYVISVAAEL
ncbi:hypothetical protein CSOJ01_09916 [Colletotrichum sojae]|uniref:Uncharacterized protein n=1 Tax=Colletotrichum sojae TaxID=2175907 RepID=A0A8H6J1L1_9PEZI|nr:hypothetical protein CSOJ01_09916 [Colletotrichum sojae]